MYPDPFYNAGGAQYPPVWYQMPPEFSLMPFPYSQPEGGADDFAFTPPPPPDFSGFYPGQ